MTIRVPLRRADGTERFPVVYATDSNEFFGGYADLAAIMQAHGDVPRFVLVGIGYDDGGAAQLLRMRDFWPSNVRALYRSEMEQLAASPFVTGIANLDEIIEAPGAPRFSEFFEEELMPLIDSEYPVIAGHATYVGYSAGGGFGLYTLFHEPGLFKNYVLGSPATSFNGRGFAIEWANAFICAGRTADADLYMSVGEREDEHRGLRRFELVGGYLRFRRFLDQHPIQGLRLTCRTFPGETHATAWTLAFSHGLKTVLGSVNDLPFWPDYFR